MKIFKDLYIEGDITSQELTHALVNTEDVSWSRYEDRDSTQSLSDERVFCFRYEGEIINQPAFLFFTKKEQNRFYIPNVVPENGMLTHDEYNDLVDSFHDYLNRAIAGQALDVRTETTDEEIIFEDVVPEDIQRSFFAFSNMANKSTGSAHPNDRNRWYDFICLVYDSDNEVRSDLLESKLVEEGWSEDMANKLIIEFQFGLGILNHCN